MFKLRIDHGTELRLLEPSHATAIFSLVDSNRTHLRRWLPWVDGTRTREDSIKFIQAASKQHSEGYGFHAGIWDGGQLAGVIGYHRIDWMNRNVEIGYWLAEPFQGRGLARRAAGAIVHHSLKELGLNRVTIRCAVGNTRSQKIPRALGFTQEGVLREAEFLYDHYVDLIVFGMLAADWPEAYARLAAGGA